MRKSPYQGFTPLNRRRTWLVNKRFTKEGLTYQEKRELHMLDVVVGAMVTYAHPLPRPGFIEKQLGIETH